MKRIYKRFFASLLCVAVLLTAFASCSRKKTDLGDNSSGSVFKEKVTLISDNASDYFIVYSEADAEGEWLAKEVQRIILGVTGVNIKTRSDTKSFDKEIIVGNAKRECVEEIKTKLNSDGDFAIAAYGGNVCLYSNTPALTETMLLTFERIVVEGFENNTLSLYADLSYLFSVSPLDAETGETLFLVSDRKSDYVITCDTQDTTCMNAAAYLKQSIYEATGVFLRISDKKLSFDKEIYIGFKDNKQEVFNTYKRMDSKGDFAVCVDNSKLVITGNDAESLLSALLSFERRYLINENMKEITVKQCDNIIGSKIGERYDFTKLLSAEEYCKVYQSVYKTYSTYIEDLIANDGIITQEIKADKELVEALIERLGESMVFEVGSSSVLYRGMIRKLDVNDYSRTAKLISGNCVAIPKEFLDMYYHGNIQADASGYVDLTALCDADESLSFYYNADKQISIVYPKDVEGFSEPDRKYGNYTNAQFIERMYGFFHSEMLPEPSLNVEQTRVIVEHIEYPQNVLDYKTNYYRTTYSPSITKMDGDIYVSYEISEVCNISDERSTVTKVKKSSDGGLTWTEFGEIAGIRWATVFALNGRIYLLGNNLGNNNAMIAGIDADGKTRSADIAIGVGGGAPTAVIVKDGRIYKAFGRKTISADITSDLFESSSWLCSQDITELFTTKWLSEAIGRNVTVIPIEPNIVAGKDGELYVFFRIDAATKIQLVAKLTDNGTRYEIAGEGIISNFPTSKSKITIRYDEATDKYITISSPYMGGPMQNQRIVLCIAVSDDLFHWDIKEYLLVSRNMANPVIDGFAHGLQYADFIIDGEDILFVVREAVGYTCSYHDGNYTTFYRLMDYKQVIG